MTSYNLSGAITGQSAVASIIDLSNTANYPSATTSNIAVYSGDPSAPTTASVAPGVPGGVAMDAPSVTLSPFLRTTFQSNAQSGSGDRNYLTVPAGVVEGDLMVAIVVTSVIGAVPAGWLTSGWTKVAGLNDPNGTDTISVWTRTASANEAGKTWQSSSGASWVLAQVRVYGNATFDRVVITENSRNSSSGDETGPAFLNAKPSGLVIYAWGGNCGTIPWITATVPSPLGNVVVNNAGNYVALASADLAVVSATQPARTANLVSRVGGTFGRQFQTVISLAPLGVYRYASVAVEEAVGPNRDIIQLGSRLHLLGSDIHSPQTDYGFATAGMSQASSGTVYSYERWVRLRFEPTYNTLRAFRLWAPNLAGMPPGWTVKYGTTSSYSTPVNAASSVATTPVPTSDPGRNAPNAGGVSRLIGTGRDPQFSDWIVLQASADVSVIGPGPVLGFSLEGTVIPIQFMFAWIET